MIDLSSIFFLVLCLQNNIFVYLSPVIHLRNESGTASTAGGNLQVGIQFNVYLSVLVHDVTLLPDVERCFHVSSF